MPAYTVKLRNYCAYPSCTGTATHEVFNAYNSSSGMYCNKHATAQVNRLNHAKEEAAWRNAGFKGKVGTSQSTDNS